MQHPAQSRTVEGLTEDQAREIEDKQKALFTERKNRDPNLAGLATREELSALQTSAALPLHSTTQPGILALALSPGNAFTEPALVATGAITQLYYLSLE
jgi:hypothetical protein